MYCHNYVYIPSLNPPAVVSDSYSGWFTSCENPKVPLNRRVNRRQSLPGHVSEEKCLALAGNWGIPNLSQWPATQCHVPAPTRINYASTNIAWLQALICSDKTSSYGCQEHVSFQNQLHKQRLYSSNPFRLPSGCYWKETNFTPIFHAFAYCIVKFAGWPSILSSNARGKTLIKPRNKEHINQN